MNKEEIRQEAKKKVEAKKGFYVVAIVFTSVSVILLVLSLMIPGPALSEIPFSEKVPGA